MTRARGAPGIVLAGGFALLWAGMAAPADLAGQVGRSEVTAVRFRGNEAFPSDSLARAIVTRQTECRSVIFLPFCWAGAGFAIDRAYLPGREFQLDPIRLKVWYQQRGYREANIDTETSFGLDGTVRVTFLVEEGRPVRVDSVEYVGIEQVSAPDLLRELPLRAGRPLSAIDMDATRDTLARRLQNQGYAHAEVLRSFRIASADPYSAVVTFDVAPGPGTRYGHVSVEGNEALSESTVLRTLQFRSGDLYRASQLQDAQARLFGLEIVQSASVSPNLGVSQDSVIDVAVRIQEGDLRRLRLGSGWTTSECIDVDTRWVHRNFLGNGRRLQVRGRVSNILAGQFQDLLCPQGGGGDFASLNWIASVDLAQPWIFSTRNSFQASVYGERQSLPDVFIRKAVGLSLGLTRNIGPRSPLTLSYRPERSRLDAAEIMFCTNFLVCAPEDISVLQGDNWLAPVGLYFLRNVTNNLLNPTRGYAMSVDLEHAEGWTGSSFSYTRLQLDAARFTPLAPRSVLAGRLRVGWVSAGAFDRLLDQPADVDIVHPQKRFYAGGANSVRGYPQSRLGPRVLTADVRRLLRPVSEGGAGCTPSQIVDASCDASALDDGAFEARPTGGTTVLEGSLEARFPLSSTFQGAVFTDFGQVWAEGEPRDPGSLRVTPGFGFRYLSPIGPLRVDMAYRLAGGEQLQVITNGIAISAPGGEPAWETTDFLVALKPRVLYDDAPATSLRRWQIHISIGQAF